MLSQNDPQWKTKTINGTTSTLGNYGCLLTCLTAILNEAGYVITPDQLANYSQLFVGDLWNGWKTLQNLFSRVSYSWGVVCQSTSAPIDKIIAELDAGYFPIIMVDSNLNVAGIQTHYLRVTKHVGNDLYIHDPWDGVEKKLSSCYGSMADAVKIQKVDCYHFTNPTAETVETYNISENVYKYLYKENNFSEGDIREGMENFKKGVLKTLQTNYDELDKKYVIATTVNLEMSKQQGLDVIEIARLNSLLLKYSDYDTIVESNKNLTSQNSILTEANKTLVDRLAINQSTATPDPVSSPVDTSEKITVSFSTFFDFIKSLFKK